MTVAAVVWCACVAAGQVAHAESPHSPQATTVGGQLFNRHQHSIRDAQHLGDTIRKLAEASGYRADPLTLAPPTVAEAPPVWQTPRAEELHAMDPLTVSLVDLPTTLGTGALLLTVLWLARCVRQRAVPHDQAHSLLSRGR